MRPLRNAGRATGVCRRHDWRDLRRGAQERAGVAAAPGADTPRPSTPASALPVQGHPRPRPRLCRYTAGHRGCAAGTQRRLDGPSPGSAHGLGAVRGRSYPPVTLATAAAIAVSIGLNRVTTDPRRAAIRHRHASRGRIHRSRLVRGVAGWFDAGLRRRVRGAGARVDPPPRYGEADARSRDRRGFSPFWSPDGRSIAFYAVGRLKRVDLDSGLVRTIAASDWGGGGGLE